MKTRIIKSENNGLTWFTPQWSIDGTLWIEFFGFDPDSPYLHLRAFRSAEEARLFLEDPSIMRGEVVIIFDGATLVAESTPATDEPRPAGLVGDAGRGV